MNAFASTLIFGLAAATPASAQLVNGDFEAGLANWRLQPSAGYTATTISATPGQALRLARVVEDAGGSTFGALSQTFDATPYRGKRVIVTVRARVLKPDQQVGLVLRIDRPQGAPRGAFVSRPAEGADWADYRASVYVAPDAARIYVGLVVSGDGVGVFDDLHLAVADTAASADVLAYLDNALALLRQHHYRSADADWPAIIAEAHASAVGATTPADVHAAIQGAIQTLGERHTLLMPPAMLSTQGPRQGVDPSSGVAMPVVTSNGNVGVARLPGLRTSGGAPDGLGDRYAAMLSDAITAHNAGGGCGWIVDLRQNSGGNMWPMLNGLSALLGDPPFGWFIGPAQTTPWIRAADGRPTVGQPRPIGSSKSRQAASQPIAVLMGPRTGSSGEMTAIAVLGRDRVRSFGQATAGLSTANTTFSLSDGATLLITTANAGDRTGHQYDGPLQPDEPTPLADAEAAALRWLSEQGCKPAS